MFLGVIVLDDGPSFAGFVSVILGVIIFFVVTLNGNE
jgi:hypothetical protein